MKVLQEVAESQGVPSGGVTFIDRPDKDGVLELTRLPKFIDGCSCFIYNFSLFLQVHKPYQFQFRVEYHDPS